MINFKDAPVINRRLGRKLGASFLFGFSGWGEDEKNPKQNCSSISFNPDSISPFKIRATPASTTYKLNINLILFYFGKGCLKESNDNFQLDQKTISIQTVFRLAWSRSVETSCNRRLENQIVNKIVETNGQQRPS